MDKEQMSNGLLQPLGMVRIKAIGEFIARDKFTLYKDEEAAEAAVKIAWISDHFQKWFFDKIEEPTDKSMLYYNKLLKQSRDVSIIASLGGADKAEATLGAVFFLLERQGRGKKGVLITNVYRNIANIFYIRDINGILQAVKVNLYGLGWGVDASPLDSQRKRNRGARIFADSS